MINIEGLQEFTTRLKSYEQSHHLDLSSAEDLSVGLMNLISIEEHLFFTAEKTNNPHYLEILAGVRQIRKNMQQELTKDTEGETWCIAKHLLAASMRLFETGNKLQLSKPETAKKFYDAAYESYQLFWALNLKLIAPADTQKKNLKQKNTKVKSNAVNKITVMAEKKTLPNKKVAAANKNLAGNNGCQWQRFASALNRNLDCCHE